MGSSTAGEKKVSVVPMKRDEEECCTRKRAEAAEASTRDRLKRHRREVAGRVWIPESWGQEQFLAEWTDCAAVDRALFPAAIVSAREALVEECRRALAARPGVANSC